jgi:hypothetical protein
MTAFAGREFFQSCDDEDAVPGMLSAYASSQGFIGTGEYEPIGADNSFVATGLPAACLTSDPATVLGERASSPETSDDPGADDAQPAWSPAQGSCEAVLRWQSDQPEHKRLVTAIGYTDTPFQPALKSRTAAAPHPRFLILRLRSFPAWRIAVNGYPVASPPRRDDGLIVVPVWPGTLVLTVDWTTTPDVIAGRWLSALAALLLAELWLMERKLSLPDRKL